MLSPMVYDEQLADYLPFRTRVPSIEIEFPKITSNALNDHIMAQDGCFANKIFVFGVN